MSRVTFIWFTLYLLYIYCYRYSLAQDLSQIKPTIDKEREIVRIRNKILKELVNNGAKISRSDAINHVEPSKAEETVTKEITIDSQTDIRTDQDTNSRSKALVTLGEPASQARDKCLAFHIRKYVKNVEYIVPKKIDLWIHIRKRENKKSKKKNNKQSERMLQNGIVGNKKDKDRTGNDRKKGRRKNKKRRHGRRIKIFISDGTKTLVKIRMRIRKTKWHKIELPISQFPDVISVNDSFKLCFKCKRCSKKIKMDLYRTVVVRELNTPDMPPQRPMDKPTIPFIHFEEPRSQHIYRYKRSSDVERSNDVINIKHRHHHFERSRSRQIKKTCCQEEIYIEEISKLFPNIIFPESVNISICTGNINFYDQPLLSQTSESQTPMNNLVCVPTLYKTFHFVYLNNKFNIKHASIPDLIPIGCSCHVLT